MAEPYVNPAELPVKRRENIDPRSCSARCSSPPPVAWSISAAAARLHCVGSSALVGSSHSSRSGFPSSACAIPRRCFIPRENPRMRRFTPSRPDECEQFRRFAPRSPAGSGCLIARTAQVFLWRHIRVEFRHIGQVADREAFRARPESDRFSAYRDRSIVRPEETCDQFHRRGFPRAVFAEKAIDGVL